MKQQRGFTLVEIAIVLVIIGLLLGGVLKGQELLTNARVKRVINDFDGTSAAIFSYQDRYKQMPGDDNTANGRWGATNGNGNGIIAGNWNQNAGNQETRLLWQHLRNAGLVAGVTTGAASGEQARNAYGGLVGVDAANLGLTGVVLCQGALPGKVAAIIDTQTDDGVSNTGQVVSALGTSVNNNANPNGGANIYTQANENTAMTMCKNL